MRAWVLAGLVLALAGPPAVAAEPPPILTGRITSAEEGAMEGVLVSARRADANVTVTVVSDADGVYRFPADRLQPGPHRSRSAPSATSSSGRRRPNSAPRADRDAGSAAAAPPRRLGPALERRMARQHAGKRRREGADAHSSAATSWSSRRTRRTTPTSSSS